MRMPRWKSAYYVSLLLLAAGILLLCLRGESAALAALGGTLLLGGGLVRFAWCRCPHCGAVMMRLRRGNLCPACLQALEDENKKD